MSMTYQSIVVVFISIRLFVSELLLLPQVMVVRSTKVLVSGVYGVR